MLSYTLANHKKDYTLTKDEMTQFLLNAAPYAKRHAKLGYRKISFFYKIPLIGQLGALIERMVVWVSKFFSDNPYPVFKRYKNEASNPDVNFSERLAVLNLPTAHRYELAKISSAARASRPDFFTVELPLFNLSFNEHVGVLVEKLNREWNTGRAVDFLQAAPIPTYYWKQWEPSNTPQAFIDYLQTNHDPSNPETMLDCYRRLNVNHPELYLRLRFPEKFTNFDEQKLETKLAFRRINEIFLEVLPNLSTSEIWHLLQKCIPETIHRIPFPYNVDYDVIWKQITDDYNKDFHSPEAINLVINCLNRIHSFLGLTQIMEVENKFKEILGDVSFEDPMDPWEILWKEIESFKGLLSSFNVPEKEIDGFCQMVSGKLIRKAFSDYFPSLRFQDDEIDRLSPDVTQKILNLRERTNVCNESVALEICNEIKSVFARAFRIPGFREDSVAMRILRNGNKVHIKILNYLIPQFCPQMANDPDLSPFLSSR